MRRIHAIAVIVALLAAPLALVANGVNLSRYEKALNASEHDEDCQHVALGICGCHPGSAPAPVVISPLPDMVLTPGISQPATTNPDPNFPAPASPVLSGFVSSLFHPPRG